MANATVIAQLAAKLSLDAAEYRRGLKSASKDTDQFERGLRGLETVAAGVMVGFGAAFAAGLGKSVSAATEFEKTISGIKAVSGAAADQMEQLSGKALQLGKDTSFSASQAALGIEELVKGGVSITDIMSGAADATLQLAAAGKVDLPTAATIAANAMSMFGKSGAEMAGVVNMIAGFANATTGDVNDFRLALQQVGAVAKLAGQDFNSTAVAIAIMADKGLKGSDAGTSLKTMLMNLQPTTKAATATMRELGIITADGSNQFVDATGKIKSMSEIAEVLHKATEGLTEAQKLQKLETIFGSDAIRAAALIAEAGSEGFDKMAESMGKVTAEAVAAERLNNLAGDVEQLQGSLETTAIMIGTMLLPALRDMSQGANEKLGIVIDRIGEVQQSAKDLSEKHGLSQFDAAVVATSQVLEREFGEGTAQKFNGVITGLSDLKDGIGEAGRFAGEHEGTIKELAIAIGLLVIANEAARAVQALSTAFAVLGAPGGPIIKATVVIAGFVAAPGIEAIMDGSISKEVDKIGAAFSGVGTAAQSALSAVTAAMAPVRAGLDAIGGAIDRLTGRAQALSTLQGQVRSAATDPYLNQRYGGTGEPPPTSSNPRGFDTSTTVPMPPGLQGSLRDQGRDLGASLGTGISEGAGESVGGTSASVIRGLDGAIDQIANYYEIASPSRRTKEKLGKPMGLGVIDGFMEGLQENRASLLGEMNKVTADLGSSMIAGIRDNTEAGGKRIATSLEKVVDELRKSGVENWRELGDDLAGAVHDALIAKTPEARDAALDMMDEISDVIDAALAAKRTALAGYQRAVSEATGKAMAQQTFGGGADVQMSFIQMMSSNLDKDAITYQKKLSDFVATLQKNQVPEWEALGEALEAAGFAALLSGSEEDLATFNAMLADAAGQLATTIEAGKPKARTATQSFLGAITEVARGDEWVKQFGETGSQVIGNLTEAIETGSRDTASKLGNSIQKMIAEAKRVGVPGANDAGAAIIDALRAALDSKDPELIASAMALVEGFNAQIVETAKAKSTLSAATFAEAWAHSLQAQGNLNRFGTAGVALMDAALTAMNKGGAENIARFAETAAHLSGEWQKNLKPEQAAQAVQELMDAVKAVTEGGGSEAIATLDAVIARYQQHASSFKPGEVLAQWTKGITEGLTPTKTKLTQAMDAFRAAMASGDDKAKQQAQTDAQNLVGGIISTLTEKLGPEKAKGVIDPFMIAFQNAIMDGSEPSISAFLAMLNQLEEKFQLHLDKMVSAAKGKLDLEHKSSHTVQIAPTMPNLGIKAMATGGIVTGPTLALMGEAGVKEAAIPLTSSNLAAMSGGGHGGDVAAALDRLARQPIIVQVAGREIMRAVRGQREGGAAYGGV